MKLVMRLREYNIEVNHGMVKEELSYWNDFCLYLGRKPLCGEELSGNMNLLKKTDSDF